MAVDSGERRETQMNADETQMNADEAQMNAES